MSWGELVIDAAGGPGLWRVPAARMKLATAKKGDAANDHLVPLSAAAADVLRDAPAIAGARTGPTDLVFAGRAGVRPIGEAAIGALYARAGFTRAARAPRLAGQYLDDHG
jgi:hypothetical protein